MKWFHKCSLDWLSARQKFLTATDVMDLLPVSKTGRARKIGNDQYLKVMARKMKSLDGVDCESHGAAARGHILEPWAVHELAIITRMPFEHWDDCIVTRPLPKKWSLAYSPDALTAQQPKDKVMVSCDDVKAKRLGEVKSYSAEKHLVCGYSDKMDLEERWQIAVAMAVDPDIEEAFLIFYNPSMRREKIFLKTYKRKDLEAEIKTVLEVEENWLDFVEAFDDASVTWFNSEMEEADIIDNIIEAERLDPDSEKTVVM